VKTSLAPGRAWSRATWKRPPAALPGQARLHYRGYGCTTCIGNSGPLEPHVEQLVTKHDLIAASVLSGNRKLRGAHSPEHQGELPDVAAARWLRSPSQAGWTSTWRRIPSALDATASLSTSGHLAHGRGDERGPGSCRRHQAVPPELRRRSLARNPRVGGDRAPSGLVYQWDPKSTYIREPPYFENFTSRPDQRTGVRAARALAIFGDSVPRSHLARGAIKPNSPAGKYLIALGVKPEDFNSYGARRGNHEVMVRGTFANVRIKNLMVPGVEGGVTVVDGKAMPIYDARWSTRSAARPDDLRRARVRDRLIAATGRRRHATIGGACVIAKSFERIHRQQSGDDGVLPLPSSRKARRGDPQSWTARRRSISRLESGPVPRQDASLTIRRRTERRRKCW